MFYNGMPRSNKVSKGNKTNINLSVNTDIHDLFKKLTVKEIMVNDNKVMITKTLTDVYNRALEFAVENVNEWWK